MRGEWLAETADGSSFGAFRAHRGGYGERPVDSDAAEEMTGRPWGTKS